MAIKTLAALKKQSKKDFERVSSELEKMTKSSSAQTDPRFWTPTQDKNGNGYAVIRFLPAPKGEDSPVIRYYDHAFQGPGGWYIEKSLTSIGLDDPVSEYNVKLWNTNIDKNREFVRGRSGKPGSKRVVRYVSNIYVVKDSGNPENEGKVFLYRFGAKIFEKIKQAMNPEFEDDPAINPYDFWEGAPFKLKIRKVNGMTNYDASEFGDQEPIADSDEEIEKIWESEYSLQEFLDPTNYKSYDELQARLTRVLGLSGDAGPAAEADEQPTAEPKQAKAKTADNEDEQFTIEGDEDEEEDDSESFFASIAEDDKD